MARFRLENTDNPSLAFVIELKLSLVFTTDQVCVQSQEMQFDSNEQEKLSFSKLIYFSSFLLTVCIKVEN